jgi:hypothetical protein
MESSGNASVTQIGYNGIDTVWWPGDKWQLPGSLSQNQNCEGTTHTFNWLLDFIRLKIEAK